MELTRYLCIPVLWRASCACRCRGVTLRRAVPRLDRARMPANPASATPRGGRPDTGPFQCPPEDRMILHDVKVHPSKDDLKREDQLAWKIAGVAADKVAVQKDVAEMIVNRIIDNASVAIAAINRRPVVSARFMALGHPAKCCATVFGVAPGKRVSPEWAAWANGTA